MQSKNATISSISSFVRVLKFKEYSSFKVFIPSATRCSYPSPNFAVRTLGVVERVSCLSGVAYVVPVYINPIVIMLLHTD